MKRGLMLTVLFAICTLASLDASAVPETYNEYYSDYFVTAVGADVYNPNCDPMVPYVCMWGTCDGNYRRLTATWCSADVVRVYCYQKSASGSWQQIACPAGNDTIWPPAAARKRLPIVRRA